MCRFKFPEEWQTTNYGRNVRKGAVKTPNNKPGVVSLVSTFSGLDSSRFTLRNQKQYERHLFLSTSTRLEFDKNLVKKDTALKKEILRCTFLNLFYFKMIEEKDESIQKQWTEDTVACINTLY